VLAIFDEASGVPDAFYEAADSWAHRKLIIGNPLSTSNFFYRLCRLGDAEDPAGQVGLLRKVIHMDGRDSPNVQLGLRWHEEGHPGTPPILIPGLLTYPEYVRREQQWDEAQRVTRLHGQFCEDAHAFLFPAAWLDVAMDPTRWAELSQQQRVAEAMGVDVAAGGRDKTCWTIVDHLGVIEQIVLDVPNSMEIAGRTIRLMEQHQLRGGAVAIDAGGGGKQIADRLHEQGYRVTVVGFGESADAKQAFRNRRAELYGKLREYLSPDREEGVFALPPDAEQLRRELAVLPLQYDSEGRMLLPPKDPRTGGPGQTISLRQLLGRSPDRADSLVLAVWALSRPKPCYTIEGSIVAWPDPNRRRSDPSAEELKTYHPLLRGIIEMSRERARRYDRDDERGRWWR
jgi:hypothetical protein